MKDLTIKELAEIAEKVNRDLFDMGAIQDLAYSQLTSSIDKISSEMNMSVYQAVFFLYGCSFADSQPDALMLVRAVIRQLNIIELNK